MAYRANFLINLKLSGQVQMRASVIVIFKNEKWIDEENIDYSCNDNRKNSEKNHMNFREEKMSNVIIDN